MVKKNGLSLMLMLLLSLFSMTKCLAAGQQKKEFRGIWIATINNVDWPSSARISPEAQKKELKELINRIEQLNLNVVILQVRPASDAFYQSETEPWSTFLTGKQGMAPAPFFDPLAYAIELCHSKGMELHAWFNPFRVRNLGYYPLDPASFAVRNPHYTHEYDHKLFLDPGIPQVRSHLIKVITEVVRKYNIDAVHLDDYFYPYPVAGKNFPDQKTFRQYGNIFYPNRLNDWRRENINQFIAALHDSIKAIKPTVKLGISPFGIWRNKKDDPDGSSGIKATTAYDHLFTDVVKWLASDWIDYVIPQLYWEQGNRFGDFNMLAKWWDDHCFGKPLYLGQALFKSTGTCKTFINPTEITDQIGILRKFQHVGGFALYSASHLAKLSETAFNELKNNLLPPNLPAPKNEIETGNEQTNTAHVSPEPFLERIIRADKKSIGDSLNMVYKSIIDTKIPAPEQFTISKYRKGWSISWKCRTGVHNGKLEFIVNVFGQAKDGGFLKKVIDTTTRNQIIILRKSVVHPARALFGIISVSESGYQSPFPKLFRIRGRRIIYL